MNIGRKVKNDSRFLFRTYISWMTMKWYFSSTERSMNS